MSKRTTYTIVFIVVIAILYFAEKLVTRFQQNTENQAPWELEFGTEFLPTSTTGAIIYHDFYTLSYSESHEQAEWVAYELQKKHLSGRDYDRPYFERDPKITTKSAHWRNYKNSGYDRGHLCPAGDRSFSYEAFSETFLTSNISPQNHEFNTRIWNYLEQKVRFWAEKYNGLYVITGGVLEPGLKTIGDEEVSVPKAFYKIVIDKEKDSYKVLAFLIPNVPTQDSFYEYVVTIDEVERVTGIDFLQHLPDELEEALESEIRLQDWAKH